MALSALLLAVAGVRGTAGQAVGDSDLTKENRLEATVVAFVDGAPVYLSELERSYLLRPVWERGQQRLEAHLRQLEEVIDERLLAVEARRVGLHRTRHVAAHLAFLEDREVNRALYRDVVLSAIDVSDSTLTRAYTSSRRRIDFGYIRTASAARAAAYASALASTTIDSLTVDPRDDRGRMDRVAFGDIDAGLDEIFLLDAEEVLGPVEIGGSWFIVQVLGGEIDVFQSEWELAQQRSRLRHLLQQREAGPRAAQYVAELMEGKEVRLEAAPFQALVAYLQDWLVPGMPQLMLDEERVEAARSELPLNGDDVVVRFSGGEMTSFEVLQALSSLPASMIRPGKPLAPQLKDAVGIVVRNRFIAREGRRSGLHQRADVKREIAYAQDQYLAGRMRQMARQSLDIAPERLAEGRAALSEGGAAVDDDQLSDILKSAELAKWETHLIARLRTIHPIIIHHDVLQQSLTDPAARIAHDPVPILVRDIFH